MTQSPQAAGFAVQESQLISTFSMPQLSNPTLTLLAGGQRVVSVAVPSVSGMSVAYRAVQPSFEDLGTPLFETTFCVVDLETTGGAKTDEITEFGAVLVRGGEVIGEFQTLVRPTSHIPAMVQVLTGITNAMVADAPKLGGVIASFMQFCTGAVLVAHNAGFDIGFLKRACAEHDIAWPNPVVIDTVALARQALGRDEVRNCKLATLASFFSANTQPNHRALSDARATVDVLHGLLGRIGGLGVNTIEDLDEFTRQVSPDRRAKRSWAANLPHAPGVYWFTSGSEILYVGKSKNLRQRVRSYFSATEKRARIHEMVRIADQLQHIECATELEAAVRELRLIAAHAPRYNRRSKRQHDLVWLKLTNEAFPRLSVVRKVSADQATYWGPFSSNQAAEQAKLAVFDAYPIRRCSARLSAKRASDSCALAELGRCAAPCETLDVESYSTLVGEVRQSWQRDVRPLLRKVANRMRRLVDQERYEEAGEVTGRLRRYAETARRWHRLRSVADCPEVVAAAPSATGWDVHVLRYGRLAAAGRTRPGQHPVTLATQLRRTAETVVSPTLAEPAASTEETELLAAWLESPGLRLIELEGCWAWPINAAIGNDELAEALLGQSAQQHANHNQAPGLVG